MAYLRVRVTPGSSQDGLAGWRGDILLLRVRAAPERGKANESARRLLARKLGLPPSHVVVAQGASSRDKLFYVEGLSDEEVRRQLGP